ncbi:hypothetical protein ACFVRU_03710 [Streptomyces sp. NPDC057927]
MTEHIAQCRWAPGDRSRAHVVGDAVHLDAVSDGVVQGDASLRADAARTFACGIIALADEIDGGEVVEAPKPRNPQVGDRVRIVKDDPYTKTGVFVGRTGVVRDVKDGDRTMPYRVRLDDPSNTWDEESWWCAEVELVDERGPAGRLGA